MLLYPVNAAVSHFFEFPYEGFSCSLKSAAWPEFGARFLNQERKPKTKEVKTLIKQTKLKCFPRAMPCRVR